MTRERIEEIREAVVPFVKIILGKVNLGNVGNIVAEEFEKDFNEITELAINGLEKEPCEDKVKELEFTQNWIPTSERQPKENGNYLAFYCTNDGTANLEYMMVDHCNAGGGWLHEKNGKKAYTKVIAWMPLPEPYKEEKRVKND